jgi:hypothetical protein
LFQENKSFGTHYHLHSSSDVREVVSGTIIMHEGGGLELITIMQGGPWN